MKTINFELLKNNEVCIKETNIRCIENNKLTFVINNEKYSYYNNILEKVNKEEKIILNFKEEKCQIYIKGYNNCLNIKINVIENEKKDNIITIKYEIETEENVINIIKIEYI